MTIRVQAVSTSITNLRLPNGATFLKSLVDRHLTESAELDLKKISKDRVTSILKIFLDFWETTIGEL